MPATHERLATHAVRFRTIRESGKPATIDIHAELDALQAQFVVVNERIFRDLDHPAAAEVSDELLCITDWIEEVREDLEMMAAVAPRLGAAAPIRALH